ncbi:concanavalin A-like lectin/glucanase domain-containing protein [Obelidium mucronatum]|nr:concanavalin A-like lectin/glucanase domain-containing protein [Obelidium mucronatum]
MLFVTIAALASVLGQANAQSLFSSPVSWPGYPSDGFSYGGKVDNVNNQMVFTLLPPANLTTNDIGYGAIATSNQALLYGTVEATVQQATVGGCVTYLTLINQETKDEIDFEWIGNERNTVWTNMFYRGRRERRPVTMDEIWSAQINTGSTDNSVLGSPFTYRIDWTPDSITWWVNGAVIRVLNRASTFEAANTGDKLPYDHYHYPNTPLTVNFGIWDDQDVIWANGPIHWNDTAAQKGFTAKVWDIKVIPYGGNIPMHTDPLVVPALTITNFVDGLPTASPPPASPLPTKTESIATTFNCCYFKLFHHQ